MPPKLDFGTDLSRARAAEAECAAMREALEKVLAVSRDRQAFVMQGPRMFARAEQIAAAALAAPHPGAPLLAELEAARELIEGEYFHHSVGCPVSRLGGCECGLSAALAKYEAARGAR